MKQFLIVILWFIPLLLFSIFKFSYSKDSEHALSNRAAANSNSLVLPKQNDLVLVATLDGTISLLEVDSRRILWSFKSGRPIYSSYQASVNLDAIEQNAEVQDDSYIDCGDDWKLYRHFRGRSKKQLLKDGAKGLISITPLTHNGTTIMGDMIITEIVVDAKTGAVIRTHSPPRLSYHVVENPVVIREMRNILMEPDTNYIEPSQRITITRKDYAFMAYSKTSGDVQWNVAFAEIEAELSCLGLDSYVSNSTGSPDLPGSGRPGSTISTPCPRSVMVHRIRNIGHSDFQSIIGSQLPSLPGEKVLPLPAAEEFSLPVHPYSNEHDSGDITDTLIHSEDFLPLPSPEIHDAAITNLPAIHGDDLEDARMNTNMVHHALSPILSGLLLLAAGLAIYHYFFVVGAMKDNDSMLKPTVAKKKKTRKPGISRNYNTVDRRKESNGSIDQSPDFLSRAEMMNGRTKLAINNLTNGLKDGRQIGKLIVSSYEIAKGSNGTVVLEGVYDGRPVAVKRLVQTHHDVALKEIQNLIASDQHPNIVRWYGVEFDSDFVYLSLERCTCSLNDLVYLHSQITDNETNVEDMNTNLKNEYVVQLQQNMGSDKDFELCRANGYPSTQLLKLMRDVVSGLSHLHELGIIHRDLKPQNVLIIKERTLCAKLSDMGISKRLEGGMSSLTQHATGAGSSGWRAPEQLLHGRQTRAVDMFSLGCLLFFCITGGQHPFGDHFERDVNITKNQKDLFLVENIPEAVDLITHLLHPNPLLRPKAMEVLRHPLFWNSDTRLSFLRDASDRVELEDRETDSQLLKALESTTSVALGGKWDEKLETAFLTNIGRYRRYKFDSVRDLLRVIRNKLNHYRELPKEIQEILGPVPQGFDSYFSNRFPKLLMEVYRVLYNFCREEVLLSKYFKSSVI